MTTLNAAEKMLKGKRNLIKRLKQDIRRVELDTAREIDSIHSRIKLAQTLVDALEKGTLKL
jgi:hypothetical protein